MKNLWRSLAKSAKKYTPQLLIGMGLAGMAGAVISGIIEAPKVEQSILDAKREARRKKKRFTKKKETEMRVRGHARTIALFTFSFLAICGGSSIHTRRNVAIGAALETTKVAATEYRRSVKKIVSEDQARDIDEDFETRTKKKADKTIIITGDNYLVKDDFTNIIFESSIEKLEHAANEMNKRMREEQYISLDEWYDAIDVQHAPINTMVGWNFNIGYISLSYDAEIYNNKPVVVLRYNNMPDEDFRNY